MSEGRNQQLEEGADSSGELDDDEILATLSAEELKQLEEEADSSGELDDDEILATLSAEELKQLQTEMEDLDPDPLVPLGHRQKDHTEKAPTGSFDHRSLIEYLFWEKKSNRLLEKERIPATLLASQQNSMKNVNETQAENHCEEERNESEVEHGDEGGEGADNRDGNSPQIQQVEGGEPESKAVPYKSENEKELVETMKAQQDKEMPVTEADAEQSSDTEKAEEENLEQPHGQRLIEDTDSLCGKADAGSSKDRDEEHNDEGEPNKELPAPQKESSEPKGKLKAGKKLEMDSSFLKLTARPSGNPTLLDESLANIRKNKPDVNEVNLNNIENIPKDMLKSFVEALKKNKHVTSFSITNTGADDTIAFAIANMLRENKKITTLNIESNYISGKGIVAIMRCLQYNEVLTELRFHNQRHMLGHHAEMEIAKLLKANTTLLKLGYHFELPGPRMVVTNLLSRNLDQQRQRRLEQQRNQSAQEQEIMVNACQKISPDTLAMLGAYMPSFSNLCEEDHFLPPVAFHSLSQSTAPKVQLRKTPKQTSKKKVIQDRTGGNETPNLKAMIRSLKPVPRTRQAPVVELTPRDNLLNDIRQSNVAYLKSQANTAFTCYITVAEDIVDSLDTSTFHE
ncbi:leiomodin-3 [Hypanus sabinus]|uniref:leiomodin-3 n=1 Tax=Hypanus sabinus TaxID=79690 RepID=UPI0028C4B159|nr:leiomodin-3 [Hypanus sabinus]